MTFEVPIPGDYKYMASEKVWFDEDELNPIKMEIYDLEGKVMIQLDFSHFKYNTEMKF
jgi:outer membrane lipoprotein-sorting protein